MEGGALINPAESQIIQNTEKMIRYCIYAVGKRGLNMWDWQCSLYLQLIPSQQE